MDVFYKLKQRNFATEEQIDKQQHEEMEGEEYLSEDSMGSVCSQESTRKRRRPFSQVVLDSVQVSQAMQTRGAVGRGEESRGRGKTGAYQSTSSKGRGSTGRGGVNY